MPMTTIMYVGDCIGTNTADNKSNDFFLERATESIHYSFQEFIQMNRRLLMNIADSLIKIKTLNPHYSVCHLYNLRIIMSEW